MDPYTPNWLRMIKAGLRDLRVIKKKKRLEINTEEKEAWE